MAAAIVKAAKSGEGHAVQALIGTAALTRRQMIDTLEEALEAATKKRHWHVVELLAQHLAGIDATVKGGAGLDPTHTIRIIGRPGVTQVTLAELAKTPGNVIITPELPEEFDALMFGKVFRTSPRALVTDIARGAQRAGSSEAERNGIFWVGLILVGRAEEFATQCPLYEVVLRRDGVDF